MIVAVAMLAAQATTAATPVVSASGHYAYRDAELDAAIDLRTDGTFLYRIDYVGPPIAGEPPLHQRIRGIWRDRGDGRLVLSNAPTTPPGFVQVGAVRNAGVRAAITVTRTDGRPASGLSVDAGDAGDGFANVITDGRWDLPLHAVGAGPHRAVPTPRRIVVSREGDGLVLADLTVRPGGPNSFAFRYSASPVEPFRLAARVRDARAGMLEVELGQAALPMQRTGTAQRE